MTREERLRETACMVMDWTVMTDQDVRGLHIPLNLALSIARRFADAEAAAMRERAAKLVDEDKRMTRDPEVKGDLFELAAAIRALPVSD